MAAHVVALWWTGFPLAGVWPIVTVYAAVVGAMWCGLFVLVR
jgi:hypothetical protein